MIRFCPNCQTERRLDELFCEGEIEGATCGWTLSDVAIREPGWRPPALAVQPIEPSPGRTCPNGHPATPGDLLCETCGADLDGDEESSPEQSADEPTVVAGWRIERQLPSSTQTRERYIAVREVDRRTALLTVYTLGNEPDPEVYDALRILSRNHVPELIETGRWGDRAFEVSEELRGGTLAEIGLIASDLEAVTEVVREIAGALQAFSELGLRHRDLRPAAVLVRARQPL
ncbi:MAG TPA: hypothetical protein VEA60_09445, partial [Allosphingosinicella sp.]|nr:hypothetical protein [Allosphingosinicella sp.]